MANHQQKTSHFSSSESIPTEIVFEILSRLPVESLLRCKSVCKSWRSLISDPYFIKYHLKLSTTNHRYRHHHVLVCNHVPEKSLKTCPLYDAIYDHNSINPLELDCPTKPTLRVVTRIVGSCNGLICKSIDRYNLFIFNPSTRKSIQLPERLRRFSGMVSHGFGYNESSDDYIVVEITCSSQDRYDNIVMIYSSKNGNWKEIDSFPHWNWMYHSGVFLNGALHWIANQDYDDSWIIVSLNLANETYGKVLLPMDKKDDVNLKLGILGDSMCVLYDYSRHSRNCADIWVMKVYGVKCPWFKLVSISYDLLTDFENFYWTNQFFTPLCVSDDGKFLLRFETSLVVFDSKDDSVIEIQKFNGCSKACTFVESLVSPSGHENLI